MSAEATTSHEDFDVLMASLGPLHPCNAAHVRTLCFYDQDIVSVVRIPGDRRPRLDVLVADDSEGEEATRIYTEVRHQLVYDRMDTLLAGLHLGYVPTRRGYALAEGVVRYVRRSTRIGHPEPAHSMTTTTMTADEVPEDELPCGKDPDGLVAAGRRKAP